MITKIAYIPLIISALTSYPKEMGFVSKQEYADIQLSSPFIHQYNDLSNDSKLYIGFTACGPAVLTMAFRRLGLDASLDSVISNLPDSVYIKGDKFYNLSEGPKYFGFKTVGIRSKPKDIYNALKGGNPIVLNIQNYNGILGHALLITGMKGFDGENAASLIAHDPFVGPNREFEYIDQSTLRQPEGYTNPIGVIMPFYIASNP